MSRRQRQRANARPWADADECGIDWEALSDDLRSRDACGSPLAPQRSADGALGAELYGEAAHRRPVFDTTANGPGPAGLGEKEPSGVFAHGDLLMRAHLGHAMDSAIRTAAYAPTPQQGKTQ